MPIFSYAREIKLKHLDDDFINFYQEGKPFYPKICENYKSFDPQFFHGSLVTLDLSQKSTLDWDSQFAVVDELIDRGSSIFWDLYLGINADSFSYDDYFLFQSLSIGIAQFIEKFWKKFQGHCLGINLFRGQLNLAESIRWSEKEKDIFRLWLSQKQFDRSLGTNFETPHKTHPQILRIYAVERLSDYLHQLGASFPEEAAIFATFNAFDIDSPSMQAQLLSKQRFPHIRLSAANVKCPLFGIRWHSGMMRGGVLSNKPSEDERQKSSPLTGVCIPLDSHFSDSTYNILDQIFAYLKKYDHDYRIIPEALFTEYWDGLDQILICPQCLSEEGIRKLMGFQAAGGEVVTCQGELDLPNIVSWDEFTGDKTHRGRGI